MLACHNHATSDTAFPPAWGASAIPPCPSTGLGSFVSHLGGRSLLPSTQQLVLQYLLGALEEAAYTAYTSFWGSWVVEAIDRRICQRLVG